MNKQDSAMCSIEVRRRGHFFSYCNNHGPGAHNALKLYHLESFSFPDQSFGNDLWRILAVICVQIEYFRQRVICYNNNAIRSAIEADNIQLCTRGILID